MSQANQGFWLTRIANADLSLKQFYAVKPTAGNFVDLVTGATDVILGWLQNKPIQNKQASVAAAWGAGGTVKAIAGGAITEGTYVKLAATGKIVAGGAGADRNWGIALEAATADGDIIEILPTGLVVT